MPWNWELPDWPNFHFDPALISHLDKEFLLKMGSAAAYLKTIQTEDRNRFVVEILSLEGAKSSKIEGELLDRESLQSSIKKHLGFKTTKPTGDKESRMAEVLCDVYDSFEKPLTHQMLWKWHSTFFKGLSQIDDCGIYRTHPEPMQIVSNRHHHVFFEAPPSSGVSDEMDRYIAWFNSDESKSILARAAIAHVYFESIHPFEDGNGRIGRLLVEKVLAQSLGQPVLIAVSRVLEKKKKEYYAELEKCNRTLKVQDWVHFFAQAVLEAQKESLEHLYFLIAKSKLLRSLSGQINERQEKVLLRMFQEGPNGFEGGLSAEKYIAITKCSKATATRDLADLVEKGALTKTGALRHTRYQLNI